MSAQITLIEDIRAEADFKGKSFSGYKRADVKKELLKSLFAGKVENACYWCAELICCGAFIDIWDVVTVFVGKYIHLANVKLPIYLDIRYNTFKDIVVGGYLDNELKLRNHAGIRDLFAEIVVVLCGSHKKHNFERIKVKPAELDIMEMKGRLKAPNVGYASASFKKDDPKELFIPLNEFAYHVSNESKNMLLACFWVEWMLEFEKVCKKKKEVCQCQARDFVAKMQTDPIWMVWDVIFAEVGRRRLNNKVLQSLMNLFCIRYNAAAKRKRIYLLYFAVSLLTEKYEVKNDVIQIKNTIEVIKKQIDTIYKEIKKNEITPVPVVDNMNYMFNSEGGKALNAGEFEKTMGKLEMMFGKTN
uniref:Uncharacterized protein n=1 Tax=viral metagenome TaxID=1070528 RepID=A0A6C0BVC2_9ZZZZ